MMKQKCIHSSTAAAFTDLILEVFRFNGRLLTIGDQLVEPEGLTSARWQVLGAIDLAGHPVSVAQVGRRMGLSRQAVQRVANDLEAHGFITFENNPDHRRAKLVVLTKKGRQTLERIKHVQIEWTNALTKGLDAQALQEAVLLMKDLQKRCDGSSVRLVERGTGKE